MDLEKGVEFYCKNNGHLWLKMWNKELWLFQKHPDGQWVSMRKATNEDRVAVVGTPCNEIDRTRVKSGEDAVIKNLKAMGF